MASHASKWGCDVPSCNCMLEVFSPGKAIDMIKLHIESTHGIQLPPWCESMEDETQVMMKEGGYPSVKWDPSQVERDVPEGSFAGKYRHSAFLESVGDMVKVLELQMTELLMLSNMMELHRDVQNVMVDGDLPVDKVIPGSGDGAKWKLEMRIEPVSVEVGHEEMSRESFSQSTQVLEEFVASSSSSYPR